MQGLEQKPPRRARVDGIGRPLLGLLLGGLLWRGAIAYFLPLGFDEAYYYLYTRHWDWSYFDHPLGVALTTALGPWLLGDVSAFSLRFGTLLLYTGSLLLLYLTGQRLFSARAGLMAVAIASLIPIFHLGFGVLTLPDSPLIFFWTAALYVASSEFFPPSGMAQDPLTARSKAIPEAIPKAIPEMIAQDRPETMLDPAPYRPTYRLAVLGLLVGLACLGKYHGLALGFGLVGFCLTSPRYRAALVSPWMVAGLGLFVGAIAPILLWNWQHDWVSLRFQSGRAVPDRGYNLGDLLVTWLVGIAYLFPTLGLPLWWVSLPNRAKHWGGRLVGLRGAWPNASPLRGAETNFVLWVSLPLMLTFTLMGGYRQILPTWPAPGFWGATLLLGAGAAALPRIKLRRWLGGSALVIATLLLVILSHLTWGTLQRPSQYAILGGLVPVADDASVQLGDIRQLRQGFTDSAPLATALQKADFVFTTDIFLAGRVAMAIASHPESAAHPESAPSKPITCLDADLRGFAFWSKAADWVGQDGLLVTARSPHDLAQIQSYFTSVQPVGEIALRRGGAIVQTLQVYSAHHLLRAYPRPYGS